MIRAGITGGIGSGKSTVCRLFGMLGVPCYDSDARAKYLMDTDRELCRALRERFGEAIFAGGRLDRPALAARVFGRADELAALDALVHPAVGRDFEAWAADRAAEGHPYLLMESAILFESGFDRAVDCSIAVAAPEALRIARAAARDGVSRERIARRVASQMDDAERERRSRYVILNDERSLVWEQVLRLDKLLRHGASCG